MNCVDCQNALNEGLGEDPTWARASELQDHLKGCARCRKSARLGRLLQQRLSSLPPPDFDEATAARLLEPVLGRTGRSRREGRRLPAFAMAASLAVGFGLALLVGIRPDAVLENDLALTLPAEQVQPVQLAFNSPRDLSGVTLKVELPDGVELASHEGLRELTWQTDLQAGQNLLQLPVIVRGEGGVIVAQLSYGRAQRRFEVAVRPQRKPNAFVQRQG